MTIAHALLRGLQSLPGFGFLRIVVVVVMLCALGTAAGAAAFWIRRHGSPKLKESLAVSLFAVVSAGLFLYWPWRFALVITVLIGACLGADFLKRRGYLPNDGE